MLLIHWRKSQEPSDPKQVSNVKIIILCLEKERPEWLKKEYEARKAAGFEVKYCLRIVLWTSSDLKIHMAESCQNRAQALMFSTCS